MATIALTDYEKELQEFGDRIESSPGTAPDPADLDCATRHIYRLYQRASLSGNLDALPRVETAIDDLIGRVRYPEDLYLLKANIAFKVHRLDDVERHLAATPLTADTEEAMKLHADLLFQRGRYAEAKAAYLKAIEFNRTWDNLARYAHFVSKLEDAGRADELYAEAEDEVMSKQMRSYAWVELQRGDLDRARGRYEDAAAHYRNADRAYSGYWMTDEHVAGLLLAQGRLQEAAALYEGLVARVGKPEFAQSLGSVYAASGDAAHAGKWYERALSKYVASANRGEVHYYHHMVDFCCEVSRDGAEAVRWARLDIALRRNFSTLAALAQSLLLDGQVQEAVDTMDEALASGVVDARIFALAARIYAAGGRHEDGHRCAHRAADLNPRAGDPHVHHHHH